MSDAGHATAETGASRRYRLVLGVLLGLAALLRLAHWSAVREAPFVAQLALDAAEYDRWASAIAAGDWLGSAPFFQAPLYPYLLAGIYTLVGRSLDLVYLLQIAVGVAGIALLAAAARRLLDRRHALVTAGLAALYLPFVFHEVQLAKEAIAAALASALLLALVVARARASWPLWLASGALLGLLALLRENALLLLPFLLPLTWRRGEGWKSGRRALALAIGVIMPLLPVAARNAALGGGFLPTTFQGGVNLWIGNNPDADGTYRPLSPGKQIPALERDEAERLAEEALSRPLSGAQVSRYWFRRTLDWAAAEPIDFVRLQLRKLALYLRPYEWPDVVDYYWMKSISPPLALAGLEWGSLLALAAVGFVAARRRLAALAPIVLFEAGWLVATIAFFLFSRYRLPAAPGLAILAAIPIVALRDRWRRGRRASAVAGALVLLGVVLAPHLWRPAPRIDLLAYNLGRLAEEAGDAASARRQYERALAADPTNFLPAMNLGTLAARSGDLELALRRFEQAVALEPRSDDAWANLGAAHLARGELAAARAALERALALNRRHPAASRNLQLLDRRHVAT